MDLSNLPFVTRISVTDQIIDNALAKFFQINGYTTLTVIFDESQSFYHLLGHVMENRLKERNIDSYVASRYISIDGNGITKKEVIDNLETQISRSRGD